MELGVIQERGILKTSEKSVKNYRTRKQEGSAQGRDTEPENLEESNKDKYLVKRTRNSKFE